MVLFFFSHLNAPDAPCPPHRNSAMTHRITLTILLITLSIRIEAALVRVVSIEDARTVVVDRAGKRERVQLAGVAIVDAAAARTMLEWTLVSSWILAEAQPGGGFLVWRSPDALFVNRELVVNGYARATLPQVEPTQRVAVTYLGTVDPGGTSRVSTAAPERGTSSGKTAPTRARPSRRGRSRK